MITLAFSRRSIDREHHGDLAKIEHQQKLDRIQSGIRAAQRSNGSPAGEGPEDERLDAALEELRPLPESDLDVGDEIGAPHRLDPWDLREELDVNQ